MDNIEKSKEFESAADFILEKDFEQAEQYYLEAIQLNHYEKRYLNTYEILYKIQKYCNSKNNNQNMLKYSIKMLRVSFWLSDEARIGNSYMEIGRSYNLLHNYPKSIKAFYRAIVYLQKAKLDIELLRNYRFLAVTFRQIRSYERAIDFFTKAYEISQKIDHYKFQISLLISLGVTYGMEEDFDNALRYFYKADEIIDVHGDDQSRFDNLMNIGNVLGNNNQNIKSLNIYRQAEEIYESNQSLDGYDSLMHNLGNVYMDLEEYEKAEKYYFAALELKIQKNNPVEISKTLRNIGSFYRVRNNHEKALKYFIESLDYLNEMKDYKIITVNYYEIADIYYNSGDYETAVLYCKKALDFFDDFESISHKKLIYMIIHKCYEKLGNLQKSILYLRKYVDFQKMEMKQIQKSKVEELQFKYELGKKEKEAEIFRLKNIELKKMNETKNKFFTIIAHDLKNYFSTIISGSRLIVNYKKSLNPKELDKIASELLTSTLQTNQLLQNLLQWARAEIGLIQNFPKMINLYDSIKKAVTLIQDFAKKKNIQFTITVPNDSHIFIDENMLISILNGIIFNSIKYSHPDGVIGISSQLECDFVKISVSDYGVGISKENLNRIFKLNEHFTTKGTANEKGSGLGLLLCKEFIEKNGGEIWINSEVDIGTTVNFTVPLKK